MTAVASRGQADAPVELEVLEAAEAEVDREAGSMTGPSWLRIGEHAATWIWAGVAAIGAGFALVALAWAQVAGEHLVYRQIPYVVSAGLPGLGLVVVGLTVLTVAARDRDRVERRRQLDQLIRILEELRAQQEGRS